MICISVMLNDVYEFLIAQERRIKQLWNPDHARAPNPKKLLDQNIHKN